MRSTTAKPLNLKKKAMRNALWAMRFFVASLSVPILSLLPGSALGQGVISGVSGFLEFDYGFLSTTTKDATGNVTKTETNTYNPRLNLNLDTTIFPNLRLNAGGIIEQNISIFKSDDSRTESTTTDFRPFINLTLSNPLYNAGIGYNRRQETVRTSGSPGVNTVDEDYNAILGWKPVGFPSIDVRLTRTDLFDTERVSQDTTTDFIALSSRYAYKGLDIRYEANYTDTKDKLNHLETKDMVQTGRITYIDSFLDSRVSLNSSYNISYDETKTSPAGGTPAGTVSLQIFPFAGLSLITDTPTMGALSPNPALIDGNLTASTGMNIGLPGLGGDTTPRNIGLDFLNVTEVNGLFVWVDRDLSSAPTIANSFSWDIYTSSDNLNWTFFTALPSAPFGPFQNRFDINFPNVKTRFIKIVVKPLSSIIPGASSFPNIFITELQAFLKEPASQVAGKKITRTTHILNTDVRASILNIPTLYYDLSFFFNRVDPSGQQTYTLSNGLFIYHRFSQIFSGSARVAIENGTQENESRIAYVYNALIVATPLTTLRDTLVYSGRTERIDGKPNNNNSIFLNNTATLYKGIDINLNGGLNFSTAETGQKQKTTMLLFGTNIVPHRTITLSLNFVNTITDQSGGGQPSSSTFTRQEDVSISYNPFNTLHIFASMQILDQKDQKVQINQNYGLNWSPFPDGALQFSFTYNESLSSQDNSKSRIITPSVRWNITSRSYLDVSYQMINSSSKSQTSDSNGVSANLKIFF